MTLENFTAAASLLAAAFAGVAAWLSYRLAKKIRDELKSDEILVAGVLHHPELGHRDHSGCVLQTTLFNKSKRKAFIHNVRVLNRKGEAIHVSWAESIDSVGNPQGGSELIGVVDSVQLFVRHHDGEALSGAVLEVSHSFSPHPLVLKHDVLAGSSR